MPKFGYQHISHLDILSLVHFLFEKLYEKSSREKYEKSSRINDILIEIIDKYQVQFLFNE